MPNNTLNTRIKLKYDYLDNWNASSSTNPPFIPLEGEACVAIIPNSQVTQNPTSAYYEVKDPSRHPYNDENKALSGLSPYAIGIKIGDGRRTFVELPWIQAIAGDVYAWAKGASPGSSIQVSYNNETKTLQQTIDAITTSIGGIVSSGVSADALSTALAQLAQQFGEEGEVEELFASNTYNTEVPEGQDPQRIYPTKIVRSITKTGLTIDVQGDNLTADDIPILPLSKVGLVFENNNYDATNNKAVTKSDLETLRSQITSTFTGAMHFIGILSSPAISDGSTTSTNLTIDGNTYTGTLRAGDVVIYQAASEETPNTNPVNQEYVWTGTMWELLGDEGSYAVKGSITKTDLASALQTEINGKLNSSDAASTYVAKNGTDRLMTAAEGEKLSGIASGAQVNVIETVQVNGTALTATNKTVNVIVPSIAVPSSSATDTTYSNLSVTSNSVRLAKIAATGDPNDLVQGANDYLILNCGSASTVI